MKRKFLSAFLAGIMSLSLVACGSSNNKANNSEKQKVSTQEKSNKESNIAESIDNPVEIEFWHAMSGEKGEALKKMTDEFNAENENITVKLVDQGGYRDLFQKLMGAAKAKQLPTITQIYCNRLVWYVDKGLVEDLKPYMDNKEFGLDKESLEDIPELFLEDGVWGEKQLAFPFNKSQMVLYYNEDMFNEKGIKIPTTWEEWREAAQKLTVDEDGDGKPEVYGLVLANNISTDMAPWVKQAGGIVIDEEKDKLNFNTAETKEAVEFLNGMIQDGIARLAGEDKNANVPFSQGRAAMCVASTSSIPYIEKGITGDMKWFAAPLPGHKTNDQLYYGTNVAMFNTSNPEEKLAGWKYIKFLTNTENTAYFSKETGYLPVRKSAQELESYKSYIEANPIKGVGLKSMDIGFQGTRIIGQINALDVLGEELDLVFHGEKSIDEALKDAQERGEKALKEARNN